MIPGLRVVVEIHAPLTLPGETFVPYLSIPGRHPHNGLTPAKTHDPDVISVVKLPAGSSNPRWPTQ